MKIKRLKAIGPLANSGKRFDAFKKHLYKIPIFFVILILATMWIVPAIVPNDANAAQITSRSLTLSSGVPSASGLTYSYTFTQPTVGPILSIKFVACQTAVTTYGLSGNTLGSCAAPAGLTINAGSQVGTLGGNWQYTTGFTRQASNINGCDEATNNNVLCVTRTTSATSETATTKTLTWNTQTNPSSINSTFYVGMYTYSDVAFNTPVDSGTVAAAVTQTLLVTAAVAEILVFCVGTTNVDNATTAVGNASSCVNSTVDLGTLDPTAINYSFTNGNSLNATAILRTNAVNGSSIYLDSIQDSSGGSTTHKGALKILGADCSSVPGSCITSKASQGTFTAGTQDFGMTIPGTNCGTENNVYYPCTFASGTEHLKAVSGWIGNTTSAYCSPANCNSNNGFQWDETGASDQIATAAASNVVADEALILKFAATPSITNTFGPYQVKADFTAVPTF